MLDETQNSTQEHVAHPEAINGSPLEFKPSIDESHAWAYASISLRYHKSQWAAWGRAVAPTVLYLVVKAEDDRSVSRVAFAVALEGLRQAGHSVVRVYFDASLVSLEGWAKQQLKLQVAQESPEKRQRIEELEARVNKNLSQKKGALSAENGEEYQAIPGSDGAAEVETQPEVTPHLKAWRLIDWPDDFYRKHSVIQVDRLPPVVKTDDPRLEKWMKQLWVDAQSSIQQLKKTVAALVDEGQEHLKAFKIVKRIRSGQVIESDRDAIVWDTISSGGEVRATGNIFAYGVVRGRLVAGSHGDGTAEIYATQFYGEAVEIAGVVRTFEHIPKEWEKRTLRFYAVGKQIEVHVIG